MRQKLFFILTILIFFNQQAKAIDCSDIPVDPKLTVEASYGKLNYNHSKSIEEITQIAKKFNLVETGFFAAGLSTSNINFDITIKTIGQPIGNNIFCVIPTEVKIFLSIDQPIIYISKDIDKESCNYKVVLRHEQTHQQINKNTLQYYLPLFKKASFQIIKNIKPFSVSDIASIETKTGDLTLLYNKKINILVDFIKSEILKEQRKLDNPRNYQYESNLCKE